MTALLRGDVEMVCLPAVAVTPQLASGAVKILAVSTAARSSLLPGIPTLRESGIDVEADAWNGLIAPAGTPDAIVAKIAREVAEVITAPEVRDKLATQLMEPIPSTPAAFRARIDADLARWAGDPGGEHQDQLSSGPGRAAPILRFTNRLFQICEHLLK